MRLENKNTRESLESIVLFLTRSEASELRDALATVLGSGREASHEHVLGADLKKEITVVLYEENRPT